MWGEGCAKEGEEEAAVEQDNLIGREGIRGGSDKMMEEVHGEQTPWEEFPEEGAGEKTDCMEVGRGGGVEMEAEGDRMDVRLGKHSGSGQAS